MSEFDKTKTCCFIGHRKINKTESLKTILSATVENLIILKGVCVFLFGSRSEFNSLCYETVSDLKALYPDIKRIYVYPYINDDYYSYLLKKNEDTYYPKRIMNSGKAVYIERNYEMINKSNFCICCYDERYKPPQRRKSRRDLTDYQPKSGTAIAYKYAEQKCNNIINIFEKKHL